MNGYSPEVDYEADFESDIESDYESDYEGFAEYEPEAARPRRPYTTPAQPQRGTGRTYTRPPTVRTPVTHEQLRQALLRVKQDIDRVATGVRATNANVNDLAGRTTRNLNRLRAAQQRDVARLDSSVASTRELAILGAVLGGGGSDVLLPLLVVGMDQPQAAGAPAQGGGGMFGSGSNSTLLIALAASGALSGGK